MIKGRGKAVFFLKRGDIVGLVNILPSSGHLGLPSYLVECRPRPLLVPPTY